jgi:hypothetical protein
MVSLNDSYCNSTLARLRKRGEIREDGYRFMSYRKRKNSAGSIVIYERWASPEAYRIEYAKRLEYAKKKYYENRNDPEYVKRRKQYRLRPEFEKKKQEYNRNRVNTPEKRERRRAYHRQRLKNLKDPVIKLKMRMRSIISKKFARKGFKKNNKAEAILGCSFSFFKAYIEARFKEGMSWENYGQWHFDHIIPMATAKTENEVMELNKYTNFQPLWAHENMMKRDSLPSQQLALI